MQTYQDYTKAPDKTKWLQTALQEYVNSAEYKKAQMEAEYMAGRDTAIIETVKVIYNMLGQAMTDFTAANNRISSNILHRLVSQRCSYSLGNGISFAGAQVQTYAPVKTEGMIENPRGRKTRIVDETKETLGDKFDNIVYSCAYWACGQGVCYTYVHKGHNRDAWEFDMFKATEFLPLYDEYTGKLRGGVRFWTLSWVDKRRPIIAVLYTEEGYQRFDTENRPPVFSSLLPVEDVRPYEETVLSTEADGEYVAGGSNYPMIPIVPLYCNESKTSVLDNLKAKIDALDLALSGFANDMQDVAQIYWTVTGANGASPQELEQLRDQAKFLHFLSIDGEHSSITPNTMEPPYAARESFIERIKKQIYDDFGALDVHTISAGSTNDHIDAAYQAMDEEADSFEYQIIQYIQQILAIIGIEDMPIFKRNKISNMKEQTEMVMLLANDLDRETILRKIPWLTPDEIPDILYRLDMEAQGRLEDVPTKDQDETAQEQPEEQDNQ